MRRRGAPARAAAVAVAAALLAPSAAAALPHRIVVPPPPPPRSLSVDLDDTPRLGLYPTRRRVGVGKVRVRVYNRGMDDHDLTVVDARGRMRGQVFVVAGQQGTLEVDLSRGPVTLYCSLFDHAVAGMKSTIRASRS